MLRYHLLFLESYRQRWRSIIFHSDSESVVLLALSVRGGWPRHHLSSHAVHAKGQVLVSGGDVVKQHGIGTDVSVRSHHTEDGRATSNILQFTLSKEPLYS